MTIDNILFYVAFGIMALITLGAGVATVSARNVFHSGLFLVATFFGVAGLYLLLEAEFLAVVQVLIYIGAISVLILFAIMLTRGLMRPSPVAFNSQWPFALVLAVALFGAILLLAVRFPWPQFQATVTADLTAPLGAALIGPYVLPFEVVSVLLLAALIGAFVIARE